MYRFNCIFSLLSPSNIDLKREVINRKGSRTDDNRANVKKVSFDNPIKPPALKSMSSVAISFFFKQEL